MSPTLSRACPHAPGGDINYPDEDGEERAAARGQVEVGIQQVLVEVGVGEGSQVGQHRGHLQVQAVGLAWEAMLRTWGGGDPPTNIPSF